MDIKLTTLSKGAGCGCKLGPNVLGTILSSSLPEQVYPNLIVGNDKRDDAAVLDLGDGTGIISTLDFFTPIVDDPTDFGRIASANAISDVYAMGGTPLMATAILGWPIDAHPLEPVAHIMDGARMMCAEAGIPLAGGHSIDNPDPIFGLSVTGRVKLSHLKKNDGAHVGDLLFLLKPLGVGLAVTAHKKGKAIAEHYQQACSVMAQLNKVGEALGALPSVHALTDVTGFGLLGHLSELCQGAKVGAELEYATIPLLDEKLLRTYIDDGCIPGATMRNWQAVAHMVEPLDFYKKALLCDPQTSGGLLVSVDATQVHEFMQTIVNAGYDSPQPIGHVVSGSSIRVL